MISEFPASFTPWRWAMESGEQHAGSEQELVMCLSSRALPPYTLVWREGWGEWLPALQVAELARGLPLGSIHMPRVPRLAAAVGGKPPEPPILEYPRLRLWADQLRALNVSGVPSERRITPALISALQVEDQELLEYEEITSEVPPAVMQRAARLMNEPTPPSDLGLHESIERARASAPALDIVVAEHLLTDRVAPLPEFDPALLLTRGAPAGDVDDVWQHGLGRGVSEMAAGLAGSGRTPPSKSWRWLWLLVPLGLIGALWAAHSRGVLGATRAGPPLEMAVLPAQPAAALSSAALSAAQALVLGKPLATLGCRALEPAHKLDDWAMPDVPVGVARVPGSARLALGYAQSHEQALGVTLDPLRLNVERLFIQLRDHQICSVTPLTASGPLEFRVERMGSELAFAGVLDANPVLRVGMNELGLIVGPLGGRPRPLWELPRGSLTSVPAFTPHPVGYLVATRVNGSSGEVRVGVMKKDGAAHTPLGTLRLAAGRVGLPVLASNEEVMALAVAIQRDEEAGDLLMLARSSVNELPLVASPLGSVGTAPVQIRNPALAALGPHRFALTWSEGAGSERRVRLVLLDQALEPQGTPIDVSTPARDSSGALNGALYWAGDRLLSFYFLRRSEGGYSLWARSLACDS